MGEPFKALKISENVYWVGAIDWDVRDFHGYSTDRGSTYNAYLIMADKITLVDAVKAPFKDELLSRISSVIDPKDISCIISNHSEMDHSGCLFDVIDLVKPDEVYASTVGVKTLKAHFHRGDEVQAVKDGQTVNLGNMEVTFTETRMVHWPDSMITYLPEDNLLFSQDAFGMHLASTERFADEIDGCILEDEGAKYYANILLPYSPIIAKLLSKIGSQGLQLDTVAPDHGPIWRGDDIEEIFSAYSEWTEQKPVKKALVLYDTMWCSCKLMANAICEGVVAGGSDAKLVSLSDTHRASVATDLLYCGALLVGTSTLNNNMLPCVADVLTYIRGLKPKNLVGAAFGSYGWSGEGVKQVEAILKDMKVDLISDAINVQYVPDEEALGLCFELGRQVADKLNEVCSE